MQSTKQTRDYSKQLADIQAPPQAKDLEVAILGACLLEPKAIDAVVEIFDDPEVFYDPSHQVIFSAIISLRRQYHPVDMLTVINELKQSGQLQSIGGPAAITLLTKNVSSGAHIEAHCRIVYEKYMLRTISATGIEAYYGALKDDADAFDVMDTMEQKLLSVTRKIAKTEVKHISNTTHKIVGRIQELKAGNITAAGITTGFKAMDDVTHGWQPTDLVILAARPSVGKTAFALNILRNAAKSGSPCALFSLEMGNDQIVQRLLATESQVFMDKIQTGKTSAYDDEAIAQAADRINRFPVYIDDTASLRMLELRSKARKLVDKHGVKLIIVDYLQLMEPDTTSKNANREQEISKISRQLKVMAKDLHVTVVALSQLSRSIEQRSDKTPMLSDLRESGAIEQDADMVLFLYRPSEAAIAADASLRYVGNVKIAKHRAGDLAEFPLQFFGATQTWCDMGAMQGYQEPFRQTNQLTQPEDDDEWNIV